MRHSFEYVGAIRGQGRPRFGKGRTFKAKKDTEYEEAIRTAYIASDGPCFDGPVEVSIFVQRALPKSAPKRINLEPDTHKPDPDNVAKAVLDALNGVAWGDDAQVVSLSVRKLPRVRCEEKMVVVLEGVDW